MKPKRYVVIIPAFNEARHIGRVVGRVKQQGYEVVVVDDGSKDSTSSKASNAGARVLCHPINLGKGAGLKTGTLFAFEELQAAGVVFIDADEQHDTNEIAPFIEELKRGEDIVFGVRDRTKMPFFRNLGNRMMSGLVQLLFHSYIPDIPCGFKALSKKGFDKVRWESTGYDVELEIAVRTANAKLSYAIVPVSTLYPTYQRGMTLLDFWALIPRLLEWKLTI